MTTLSIPLPDDLEVVVEDRVASGQFASKSDYIHSLIRRDRDRLNQDRLEAFLLERQETADAVEMNEADVQRMREEYLHTRATRSST